MYAAIIVIILSIAKVTGRHVCCKSVNYNLKHIQSLLVSHGYWTDSAMRCIQIDVSVALLTLNVTYHWPA